MYSVVLMAALTAGGQTPDGHGCHSCQGSCYGGCYGNYGVEGLGTGCHGSYYGCFGSYTCGGGCYGSGWGAGYGSCWGSGYGYGNCWGGYTCGGGCYGGYGWDYSSNGCQGCAGFEAGSPYFATPPIVAPVEPPVKGEPVPAPKKEPESLAPNAARLIVEVPADAKVYIDDHAMKTESERRTFQTPALDAGQTYYYEVRAEVERDGKTISTMKRVLLRAGEEARADFKGMDATATAKAK